MPQDRAIKESLATSGMVFTAAVMAVYVVAGTANIWRHEMWRDELQTWMLVTHSTTLATLFGSKVYDGHPAAWYLLLYAISRFTQHPLAMQLLHLAIASLSVLVFLTYAPFPRWLKAVFAFGYFPFYEYATISRNYGAGMLLTFVFCALFAAQKRKRYLVLSTVLFLLMQTSVFGLLLALAFAAFMAADAYADGTLDIRQPAVIAAGVVLGLGVLCSVTQMVPPADSGFATTWQFGLSPAAIGRTFTAIWLGYVPFPTIGLHFWNTNILTSRPMEFAGAVSMVTVAVLALRSRPTVLFLYVTGTSAILAFLHVKYFGFVRHQGHLFILLMACLWLGHRAGQSTSGAGRAVLLGALLAIHAGAGVYASGMDWVHPFSASKAAAQFIQRAGMSDLEIAGYRDPAASAVAGYLNRPFYYLGSQRYGTFILYDRLYAESLVGKAAQDLVSAGDALSSRSGQPVLLILNEPITTATEPRVAPLAEFTDAIVDTERFYLYLLPR
jgi:hypothetical protein